MKCKKAQKWIALYREGELEDSLQERLREHLAVCESCSRLYHTYERNERLAAQIRSHHPVCRDEGRITGQILSAVADMNNRTKEKGLVVLVNQALDIAAVPAVRRVAVACILIAAIFFGYQQLYIFSKTTQLEKQLSVAGKSVSADKPSRDMQDCIKKSERFLLKVKTGQIKIENNIRMNVHENPEIFMQYASYFCAHTYRYSENSIIKDIIVIPKFK
jgi:hypothetical protein